MPKIDLTGHIFGRLAVLSFAGYPPEYPSKARWRCRCACGTKKVIAYGYNLKNGNTASCGCAKIEATKKANTTHGKSKTAAYGVYCTMISRCYTKTSQRYNLYGARGIRVCARWRGENGFLNFVSDMGPRPSLKHSVEREDNNGPYSPKNCVWATQKQQGRNRRGNRIVRFEGRSWCLKELCDVKNMPYGTVHWRLRNEWSITRAITTPPREFRNGRMVKRQKVKG